MFRKKRLHLSKILLGVFLGIVLNIVYNYFDNPTINKATQDLNYGFNLIKNIISQNQILNDAIVVEASRTATQFGKEFQNNLINEGRRSVIVHPYDKQGTGVSLTISYVNSAGERKILLIQKLLKRNQPQSGLASIYDQIGGYVQGAGVEGSILEAQPFTLSEARDFEDTSSVADKQNDTEVINGSINNKSTYISSEYLAKIGKVLNEYNIKIVKENQYIRNFEPNDVKQFLETRGIKYSKDYNSIETTIREFAEKTGYNGIITKEMITEMYTTDNYGTDNITNLHTKITHYIIDLGRLEQEPQIYDMGFIGPRQLSTFQPNGIEIGHLVWQNIAEIEPNEEGFLYKDNIPIRYSYIPVLHNAIRILRNKELTILSSGLTHSHKDLSNFLSHYKIKHNLENIMGEFGQKANKIHNLDKCLAQGIGENMEMSPRILYYIYHRVCNNLLPPL